MAANPVICGLFMGFPVKTLCNYIEAEPSYVPQRQAHSPSCLYVLEVVVGPGEKVHCTY